MSYGDDCKRQVKCLKIFKSRKLLFYFFYFYFSPSSLSYEDTYNTLKYADRAKHIKADLKKNVFRVDQHIHQYGKIVQELRCEVIFF